MSTSNDGGPAFPEFYSGYGPKGGMSLRQWFAGMALQGMTANPLTGQNMIDNLGDDVKIKRAIARNCAEMADALIAELEKKST